MQQEGRKKRKHRQGGSAGSSDLLENDSQQADTSGAQSVVDAIDAVLRDTNGAAEQEKQARREREEQRHRNRGCGCL